MRSTRYAQRDKKGVVVSRRLDGKVVLITGTGGGQGRVAALRFASEGARVVGCDIKQSGNEETVALVSASGGQMTGMAPVDLSDPEQASAWVEEAARVHGRIDVLYNNAGAVRHKSIEELSLDDWHFGIRNEIDLVFYVTKFAWPHLKARGGVIVSTSSVAGHVGIPTMLTHCAGKSAVLAMSRVFAAEGAAHGIRSVSISPGPIASSLEHGYFSDPENVRSSAALTMLGRVGGADDIAAAAVFLASDDASFMTGCDVVIDGGSIAGRRPKS